MRWSLFFSPLLWMVLCTAQAGEYDRLYAPTPIKIYGEVKVTMPQGSERLLKMEDFIPIGAKLETTEDGELLLALQPSVSILLGHNSRAYVSQWQREPLVDPKEKHDDLHPLPISRTTVTLLRGHLYGMVDKSILLPHFLDVETGTGLMSSAFGCFALFHQESSLQALSAWGDLTIDTRFHRETPNENYQYILPAGETILIPRTGELQYRDPTTHQLSQINAHYVDDDEGAQDLSVTANALMEAESNQLVAAATVKTMASGLADLVKGQKIKTPLLPSLGNQLTSMILTRRVDSMVAQNLINALEDHGLIFSKELSLQIHQAMEPPVQSPEKK